MMATAVIGRVEEVVMWLLKACQICGGDLYRYEEGKWKCLQCGHEHEWTVEGVKLIKPMIQRRRNNGKRDKGS